MTFAVKRPDHSMSAAGTIQLSLEDKVLLNPPILSLVLYLVQTSLFNSNLNVIFIIDIILKLRDKVLFSGPLFLPLDKSKR